MKLLVGLGNPGSEYAGTRHNVGFDVVDRLAERLGWAASRQFDRLARGRFEALMLDGLAPLHRGDAEKLVLLKPTTYMNGSGRSVRQAVDFYRVDPTDLLVVVDDVALPCGRLRLRAGGSSGGHNGLRDIERALGTQQYPRLRIGIDPPPPRVPQRDYVLGRFGPEQAERLEPALRQACDAAAHWIESGLTAAMNRFNAAADAPSGDGGED